MANCELCGTQTDGAYGSGRFCSSKCARSFSSKEKRQEINQAVSIKLKGRKTGVNPWSHGCEKCSRKFRTIEAVSAHRMHCVYGGPTISKVGLEKRGWSRGLTRDTDARIDAGLKKRELSDSLVFCKGTTQHQKVAKSRYYKRTPHICEICGQSSTWNGRFLRLQVDHKNGFVSDNRWENLRKVCPNCHTQTDTFTGKNVKNLKELARVVEPTDTPVLKTGLSNQMGV